MSEILFQIIKNHVYKDREIKEVSQHGQDRPTNWLFDFKGQGLSKVFLEEYALCFWRNVGKKYGKNLQIGGMETGAISLTAGVVFCTPSDIEVTGFYIRKSRKKHDLANLIEGNLQHDIPIVLIDDIINYGTTLQKQIAILEERGYRVVALFVCLRFRDLSYYKNFIDKGIDIVSIFELNDFSNVLPVANLSTPPTISSEERYTLAYKLILTKKPNLYLVAPKSSPLLDGEFIYVGVDDGTFYCLMGDTGEVIWTYKVPFGAQGKRINSSPIVWKNCVLFGAYDGNVYCFDKTNGKRLWVFTDADWVGSSPALDVTNGVVFIGLEFGLRTKRGGVVAIDIVTGKALWKNYSMDGLTHATPAYNKKNSLVVCGCNDNFVYGFDAKSGDIVWKFETGGPVKYSAVFDDKRDLVVLGSMNGGLYVLHTKSGLLYHKFEARGGFFATPIFYEDKIIIGSLDKIVYAFNIVTKKTDWEFETMGRIFASPVRDKESIFIGSNDGKLYEIDVRTGKPCTAIQLSERIVNKIAIGHSSEGKRKLYIPTHAGELYMMEEK